MASAERAKGPYDVFLSFRGEDTRKGFVSYLYKDLVERGIHTFIDDKRLEWGKPIAPELLRAIDESKIAIVVFSKKYADSPWCLDELVHILENDDMIVFPVFYDVRPSDVRHQRNDVAEALSRALTRCNEHGSVSADKSRRWGEALTSLAAKFIDQPEIKSTGWEDVLRKAANISGLDVPNTANGNEAECIKLIVAAVSHKLHSMIPYNREDLMGMHWRADKVMTMLSLKESKTVRIVGISGMGGAGKTTLAAHIFHNLSISYRAACFLQIDAGVGSDNRYLKYLQKTLLSKILKDDSIDISHVEQGMVMIKEMFRLLRMLIVVDNVENEQQLRALALERSSFGEGSRVIITTRDNRLLLHRVDARYDIEMLNEEEGRQLLCRRAFLNRSYPPENFAELCCQVVEYADGLPLALEVLGSHLKGLSFMEWSDALRKLQDVSHKDIYSILKISYDGLDELEKRIFREIACFFKGEEKQMVTKILESLGLHPKIGISILAGKSLVSIEFDPKNNCEILKMHDLIQAMGRDIARIAHPGRMLWQEEEIVDVLNDEGCLQECEEVEEIVLKTYNTRDFNVVTDGALTRMKKLKLLSLEGLDCFQSPEYLPSGLQCIKWNDYPWSSLPARFEGKKLVGLVMQRSRIVEPITGEQKFEKLRIMDLSHCHEISRTPDLFKYPNLEELTMRDCENLVEIHPSFGVHKKLQLVDLSDCKNLKMRHLSLQMESLKRLDLSGCWMVKNFPQIEETMTALEELDLSETRIRETPDFSKIPCLLEFRMKSCLELVEVHSSFGAHCKKLQLMDLRDCPNLKKLPKILEMEALKCLNLRLCLNLDKFPEVEGNMSGLKKLNISHSRIKNTLNFSKTPCLEELRMRKCKNLKEVHPSIGVHKKLKLVDLSYCSRLTILPNRLEMESLKCLYLRDCRDLKNFPEIKKNMTALEVLDLSFCSGIIGLPRSIRHLTSLRSLHLYGCNKVGLCKLPNIREMEHLVDASNFQKVNLDKLNDIVNVLNVLFPDHLTSKNTITDLTTCYSSPDHAASSSPIIAIRVPNLHDQLPRFLFTLTSFPQLKFLILDNTNLSRFAIPEHCLPSLRVMCLRDNPLQELLISENCLSSVGLLDLRVRLYVRGHKRLIFWSNSQKQEKKSLLKDLFDQLPHRQFNSSIVSLIDSPWLFQFIPVERDRDQLGPRSIIINLDWEALSCVLWKRDSEITIWLLGSEIPDWFGYRIRGCCEANLPPTPSLYDKKFRGLLICAHCNDCDGKLKLCHQRQRHEFKITPQELLFHYIPASTECFQSCSPSIMETTGERSHKLCLLDACFQSYGPPVGEVEWGIQLVYEDGVIENSYDDITMNPVLFTGDQSTASHLKVFCSERDG